MHTLSHSLLVPTPVALSVLACGVVWMVEISGCLIQDAARLMEIPVVPAVIGGGWGVKIPRDVGGTF